MYACTGCGAALKFDIESQKMKCDFCDSIIEPKTIKKSSEEASDFETNIFSCSQCGGEIYTIDSDLTGFCSYCGSNMSFLSRIAKLEKPKKIIPFKKTKDACIKSYDELVKGAVFAPKEYKDETYLDGFRGIYMPYWLFHAKQNNRFQMKGKRSYCSGKYDYVDYYDLEAQLQMNYPNFRHDASELFPDDSSERIEPFDLKEAEDFSDVYLCGFYGETQDTKPEEYYPYVESIINEQSYEKVKEVWSHLDLTKPSDLRTIFKTEFEETKMIMLPVWFLSFRHGKRVSYATVNGQTGKAAAMIPVSVWKFLLGILVTTLPLWGLLNLFFSVKPEVLMVIISYFAMFGMFMYANMLRMVVATNIGFSNRDELILSERRERKLVNLLSEKDGISTGEGICLAALIVYLFLLPCFRLTGIDTYADIMWLLTSRFVLLLVSFTCMIVSFVPLAKSVFAYGICVQSRIPVRPAFLCGFLSVVFGFAVEVVHPASDYYYYGFVAIACVTLILMFLDLIHCHNITSTRPLPQFAHKGGDDRG